MHFGRKNYEFNPNAGLGEVQCLIYPLRIAAREFVNIAEPHVFAMNKHYTHSCQQEVALNKARKP